MIALVVWLAALQEPPAEVARWVERLSSEDVDQREEAARKLTTLGDPARKALAPLRGGADLEVARLARRVIGHLDWDRYLPPHVRSRPVSDWEALGSEDLRDFKGVCDKVVQESGYALGLPRRFQDETDDERRKHLFAYADRIQFDDATTAQVRRWIETLDPDAFWNQRESFAQQLFTVGINAPQIEPAFWKELLKSPARSRRFMAAWVLGLRKDSEAVPVMIPFLADSNSRVTDHALDVLRANPGPVTHAAILHEALREGGAINAFFALGQTLGKEDLDRLRQAMPKLDAHRLSSAHRILLQAGDRSFLPSLLEKLAGGNGFLLFDTGLINAALLYDTEDAVDAVLQRMAKDKTPSRHGDYEKFTFGPTGQRILRERLLQDFEDGTFSGASRTNVVRYLPSQQRVDLARQLFAKPPSEKLLEFAVNEMRQWSSHHELTEEDLNRLRSVARERRDAIGGNAGVVLRGRKDPVYREILLSRIDEPKVDETLWALVEYEDPALRPLFARFSAKSTPAATRILGLGGLVRCPAAESVGLLLEALQDDDTKIREAAIANLDSWPPALLRNREEALLKAFENTPSAWHRTRLLLQLRRLDLPRAAAKARSVVSEKEEDVPLRCTALDILRELGSEKDLPLATALLNAPDVDLASKRGAAELLLPFQPKEALEALQACASRGREEDRIPAFASLGGSRHPEIIPFLIDAAWTESREPSRAAVEALARLGGKAAQDFVRSCAAESDRGRIVPEAWPIAAVRTRCDEVLPSLKRSLRPEPQLWTLWALDVIAHRAAYDPLPVTVEQTLKPATFKEACEALARACGLEAEVSAALLDSTAKELAEWMKTKKDETSVTASLNVLTGGRPEEVLRNWKPGIVTANWGGRNYYFFEVPFPWAHVLEGKRLRFVTPDEARELLGR